MAFPAADQLFSWLQQGALTVMALGFMYLVWYIVRRFDHLVTVLTNHQAHVLERMDRNIQQLVTLAGGKPERKESE